MPYRAAYYNSYPASHDTKFEDGVGLSASSTSEMMRSNRMSASKDKGETQARPNILETGTARVSAYFVQPHENVALADRMLPTITSMVYSTFEPL